VVFQALSSSHHAVDTDESNGKHKRIVVIITQSRPPTNKLCTEQVLAGSLLWI